MFTSSSSTLVNPEGATVVLDRDDVWADLVTKARNPIGIVPGASDVTLSEESANAFVRTMKLGGDVIRERILLTPEVDVRYVREGGTPGNEGFIANTLSDLDGALVLTFTVAVNFPGVAPGSEEERAAGAQMEASYRKAMQATLERARKSAEKKRSLGR